MLIRKLLGWRHSGVSVHTGIQIGRQDAAGRRAVLEYLLRSPFSQQKMRHPTKSRTVIYRSKIHPVLERNCEMFPVLDWLAARTARIPNPSEHVVRHDGWYGHVSRGKRKKAQSPGLSTAPGARIEMAPLASARAHKHRWARLNKQA